MSTLAPFPNNLAEISEWISSTGKITTPVALERAQNAFIDTIACILAAVNEPVTERVFRGLSGSSGGVCTVAGRMETFSAENAALVNGTASHALDFDDNFIPAVTHASAVLVPALLSLGEEIGATGDQLLDAYIVGLEIQAWLGYHMIPAHYETGWHATSTIGAIGAATACVRLLTLDISTIRSAISLATSMACGSKIQFGSMTKPLHAGLASRAGITAAKLAIAGVEANLNPFDGPWGFMALYKGTPKPDDPRIANLSIVEHGLAQKRWPCCASAHRTLDAVYDIIRKQDLAPEDIEEIRTFIPDSNKKNLRFNTPLNVNEARFSMNYAVAAMVFGKSLSLDDFTSAAINRPAVREFMPRVIMQTVQTDPVEHNSIWDIPARTLIRHHDGRVFEQEVQQPVGTIDAPFSPQDLENKFMKCAGRLLSEDHAAELYRCLTDFPTQNVRHIASFMRNAEANQNRNRHIHHAVLEKQVDI